MKISKEQFVETMNALKAYDKWSDRLYEQCEIDLWSIRYVSGVVESLVKLLAELTDSPYDEATDMDYISYFMYELDWGKSSGEGEPKSIEELWEMLNK